MKFILIRSYIYNLVYLNIILINKYLFFDILTNYFYKDFIIFFIYY